MVYELKTKPTDQSVIEFIEAIDKPAKKKMHTAYSIFFMKKQV